LVGSRLRILLGERLDLKLGLQLGEVIGLALGMELGSKLGTELGAPLGSSELRTEFGGCVLEEAIGEEVGIELVIRVLPSQTSHGELFPTMNPSPPPFL